jgi:hypothetical protein
MNKRLKKVVAALNSSDCLYEYNGRLHIVSKDSDGSEIELGSISLDAFYQKGVDPMELVDHVRFGGIR